MADTLLHDGMTFADMTLSRGVAMALSESDKQIIYSLARRVASVRPIQERLREWCDRADLLYYTDTINEKAGADLWAWHTKQNGAADNDLMHVSVNTPSVYVDVPSALQAVPPIENMVATDTTEDARDAAAALERVYTAWKADEDFDLKFHQAITVKSLYGIGAGRVWYDEDKGKASVQIVEQPKNLHIGYKTDSYEELEWCAYVTKYDPNSVIEEFGVDVTPYRDEKSGAYIPVVTQRDPESDAVRPWLVIGDARIEVWDYWYRQPVWRGKKFVRMDTYNVVIAGNYVVRGPIRYPEYKGELPYIPVYNTFVPGLPWGRPDLYDVEMLIREKMEQITAGSQTIHNAVAGDYWQLTGQDAPMRVPRDLKPKRNELVAPGPGNRIETITPFIAEYQLEQYLGRIDRELAAVSGLNDLLLGLAPAQVLSSSKAINALVANYESRLSMRRRLLYRWRKHVWELVLKLWSAKDKTVRSIIEKGGGTLDIEDPSLSPRDEMETATRAANLVNAKLWSQARAMDAVGVDDPETEQQTIREESTDATLWPERVQIMAQLMAALQSLGLQAPQAAARQGSDMVANGTNDLRNALGVSTPDNMAGGPGPGGAPESMGQTPPIPGVGPEAGGAQPFVQGPQSGPAPAATLQTMIQGGKASGRILTQQQLGRRG